MILVGARLFERGIGGYGQVTSSRCFLRAMREVSDSLIGCAKHSANFREWFVKVRSVIGGIQWGCARHSVIFHA